MNKAGKRFVLYALASVFVMLVVLLGIINGINFTMASEDADRITQTLSEGQGRFPMNRPMDGAANGMALRGGRPARMGPMGPDSPELQSSLRYFTFAFDEEGNGECVAWAISAVSEEDALAWAKSLSSEHETGWTAMTYRYRVYEADGNLFPTGRILPADEAHTIADGYHTVESLYLDNVYRGMTGDMEAKIRYEDIVLHISGSDCFRNAVVYTPHDRPGFCIEPQTCSTNFINLHGQGFIDESGLLVLPAGQKFGCRVDYTVEKRKNA